MHAHTQHEQYLTRLTKNVTRALSNTHTRTSISLITLHSGDLSSLFDYDQFISIKCFNRL